MNHLAETSLDEFVRLAGPAMRDEQPVLVETSISHLWFVVTSMQLASRHPGLSHQQRQAMEDSGRVLSLPIYERYPDVRELIDAGWDWQQDVDGDGQPVGAPHTDD